MKILLRSPNWVGDAVMATPVPGALLRLFPRSRIHVLAKPWVAPLWEHHPAIEAIHILGARPGIFGYARQVFSRRRERYDLGLILPNSFSAAWWAYACGCRQRVGYATEGRNFLLTQSLPWGRQEPTLPRPQVYLNLIKALGASELEPKVWSFCVKVTALELAQAETLLGPKASGVRVGIAPGSVAPSRRWPVERYARLADLLADAGHKVYLLGSASDLAVAQAVFAHTRSKPHILAGRTNLREAMAVIRSLDAVVSNDSGSMHLADAQGVPAIVLQGAADPRVTGPFGRTSRVVRAKGVACAPCIRNQCPRQLECMLQIGVDQVWSILREVLPKSKSRPRGRHGR